MSSAQIKELLHEYINHADDRFIQLVYGMVQADKANKSLLNDLEKEELNRRKERHLSGETKSISLNQLKNNFGH